MIYGVQDSMQTEFTNEQFEQLRTMLLQHDRMNKAQTFDLSKPPVEPYQYREFPKLVYLHEKCAAPKLGVKKTASGDEQILIPAKYETRKVNNKAELEKALKAGWKEEAPFWPQEEE